MRDKHILIHFTLIAAIGLSLGSHLVIADEGAPLSNFKQLCVGEKSTGFNWRNGTWEQVEFRPNRYVVRKITPPKTSEEAKKHEITMAYFECIDLANEKARDYGDVRHYGTCIAIQRVGDESTVFESCNERHIKHKDNDHWKVDFQCSSEAFFFAPNGWFHHGLMHSDVDESPKEGYKDSLSLEVGKCADISG